MASSTHATKLKLECATPADGSIGNQDPPCEDVFLEGGLHAWFTVAGTAACLFVSFAWVNCVGIFRPRYGVFQHLELHIAP
ncbi:major facilitator superfamily transporter [Penicillium atrosanguineum]|nr:major facilitator superfamily transporter [Penicillium atrosanguineum]KAJ5148677.1 major facilitator superfamily transporter [Penicillium atrosanguineum]